MCFPDLLMIKCAVLIWGGFLHGATLCKCSERQVSGVSSAVLLINTRTRHKHQLLSSIADKPIGGCVARATLPRHPFICNLFISPNLNHSPPHRESVTPERLSRSDLTPPHPAPPRPPQLRRRGGAKCCCNFWMNFWAGAVERRTLEYPGELSVRCRESMVSVYVQSYAFFFFYPTRLRSSWPR